MSVLLHHWSGFKWNCTDFCFIRTKTKFPCKPITCTSSPDVSRGCAVDWSPIWEENLSLLCGLGCKTIQYTATWIAQTNGTWSVLLRQKVLEILVTHPLICSFTQARWPRSRVYTSGGSTWNIRLGQTSKLCSWKTTWERLSPLGRSWQDVRAAIV